MPSPLRTEISKRRTFAIISHPDAGKTTLTEKFLLYGGALQLAGSVTARKNQRAATSDWMELERKRGISVSSTVLQFDYDGRTINLLDTPGHKDFSEDTYRVLTAVDAVIMVIDAGKGIENQTRKLFEICRRRGIPIFTFMNKLDRPSRDPLALLDELESVLGIGAFPVNWPLGTGPDFAGIFDRLTSRVHFFERTAGGVHRAPVTIHALSDASVREKLSDEVYHKAVDEIGMLDVAGSTFDLDAVAAGRLTPVLFGSAINNFGIQLLLDTFLQYSTAPRARHVGDTEIATDDERFSGFVFKIQANMDPKHRDRIAFVRVCSGRFVRDIAVTHVQSGRRIRLSSSHKLFGQERETVDEAVAGDVIGLVGHSEFGIGDTLTEDDAIVYREIPHFAPECFAYLHSEKTSQFKRFREGLEQLLQEGAIQSFQIKDSMQRVPLLGAVGPLQFEVVQYRLQTEYGAESRLEKASWELLRWLPPGVSPAAMEKMVLPGGAKLATDSAGRPVVLLSSEWSKQYLEKQNPELRFSDTPTAA